MMNVDLNVDNRWNISMQIVDKLGLVLAHYLLIGIIGYLSAIISDCFYYER